ncbi:hypothetical protein KVR01_011476 [Diaporthe batatas]|uniref:uncharacterized protein n=1 Tax=Diaporthe batatas TaxID=748121 RepID=UPI001D05729C|nr:uncharacterized protein KVR01_011476 [Diaporthe batatas]KAG8159033.1 hypothetical protein KVR01_011476 [Diaporthe batatas]
MADRAFFGRARSAHNAQQQPQQNVSLDHQGEDGTQAHHTALYRSFTQLQMQQPNHHQPKPPRLAKISSYIGLGSLAKAQSPTATMYPELIMERSESMEPGAAGYHVTSIDGGGPIGDWKPAPRNQDNCSFYNPDDLTWHNPSLKQMMETVMCTMMKNGSSAPIPRHLNGWIAGILEEASHQTRQLDFLRGQIEELKATREQEVIEFAKVTEEWSQREKGFKAEINRLEHIISDTQQGAESVMLARAGSVVDRNDSRAFRAKLNRLSRSDSGDGTAVEEDARAPRISFPRDMAFKQGNTAPYEVLGSTPGLFNLNCDTHLSEQLRGGAARPGRKEDQQVMPQTTGKPVPQPPKLKDSSSQSSSGNASSSSSSSLITQGFAKLAQAKSTPRTSPSKDENLYGQSAVKEEEICDDPLETIRQLAEENGGLPDDAVLDGSMCFSPAIDPTSHRPFSFSDGDDEVVPEVEIDSTIEIPTNVGNVGSSSQEPVPSPVVHEQRLDSQIDGGPQRPNEVSSNTSVNLEFSSSSSSSDISQHRSNASALGSMAFNHAVAVHERQVAAERRRRLEEAAICSPMIIEMARERSVPSPLRRGPVQGARVPRANHVPRAEHLDRPQSRAPIISEALALINNRPAGGQRARGRAQTDDVFYDQDATVAAGKELRRPTSGQDGQNESQDEAS